MGLDQPVIPMRRLVEPEILDSLDPADPAAIANRRDIYLFNRLMGNFRWFSKRLRAGSPTGRCTELGAGDGSLGLHLLNGNVISRKTSYTGLDLIERPPQWPVEWRWIRGDLREIGFAGATDTLLANLILHQFETTDLRRLGTVISGSPIRRVLLCEPARRKLHLYQVMLSRLLGVHPVSLHDAATSVRAGFRKMEICELLNLGEPEWSCLWSETFMGANRLVCERR